MIHYTSSANILSFEFFGPSKQIHIVNQRPIGRGDQLSVQLIGLRRKRFLEYCKQIRGMYLSYPIPIEALKGFQTLCLLDGRSGIIQEPKHLLKINPFSLFELGEVIVDIPQEQLVPQSNVVAEFEELKSFELSSVLRVGVEDVLQLADVLFISDRKIRHLLLSTQSRHPDSNTL